MKFFLTTVLSLVGVVLLASALGYVPTQSRWGADGVRSMTSVGIICCASAIIGAAPISLVARRYPLYIGQAALAGTTIRLLLTAALGIAYQTIAKPQLPSFLIWATVDYMLLLIVETSFSVYAVRQYYVPGSPGTGGALTGARKEAAV